MRLAMITRRPVRRGRRGGRRERAAAVRAVALEGDAFHQLGALPSASGEVRRAAASATALAAGGRRRASLRCLRHELRCVIRRATTKTHSCGQHVQTIAWWRMARWTTTTAMSSSLRTISLAVALTLFAMEMFSFPPPSQ